MSIRKRLHRAAVYAFQKHGFDARTFRYYLGAVGSEWMARRASQDYVYRTSSRYIDDLVICRDWIPVLVEEFAVEGI